MKGSTGFFAGLIVCSMISAGCTPALTNLAAVFSDRVPLNPESLPFRERDST